VPVDEELDPVEKLLRPRTWDSVWQMHVDEQIEAGADPDQFLELN
jgi:hypothetical protein